MSKRRSLRMVGAIAAGAATMAVVPALPAVGRQSPPVGQDSPSRVVVCHNGKTKALPQPAAEAHIRHGDTPGPCPASP